MIAEFVTLWDKNKEKLRAVFEGGHPDSYDDIVKNLVAVVLNDDDSYRQPDPNRIHKIDDGNYQGTLLFVIGATGYQPSDYWYVKVGYGSCSGCDTLKGIKNYTDRTPTKEQVDEYMTLALHIIQGLKLMGDEE